MSNKAPCGFTERGCGTKVATFASSHAFTWYEARLGYRLMPKLRATAAIGRRETEDSIDYTAWNIGATYRLDDNLNLDLRWYDTNRESFGRQYEDAFEGALTFNF